MHKTMLIMLMLMLMLFSMKTTMLIHPIPTTLVAECTIFLSIYTRIMVMRMKVVMVVMLLIMLMIISIPQCFGGVCTNYVNLDSR